MRARAVFRYSRERLEALKSQLTGAEQAALEKVEIARRLIGDGVKSSEGSSAEGEK